MALLIHGFLRVAFDNRRVYRPRLASSRRPAITPCPVACDQVRGGTMNSERASSAKVRRLTTPVKCLRKDPRGARHWGASSCHRLVYGRSVRILTMMQSCASAAKLRAAGPFFRSASSAMFEYGFPPPRSVNFGSRAENPARASNGAECYARSGKRFQDAGRKATPCSGSPVVTKRQSAMINLRARAVLAKAGIIVLRMPIRLSAVRARYHNASGLSF
jgi:hypothetical protein